jgi:hypothetical protein
MYCEGAESGVKDWVATVQKLRYKDYQLATKPAEKQIFRSAGQKAVKETEAGGSYGKLEEVESVKDFGSRMGDMGVWAWWRKGMGYVHED